MSGAKRLQRRQNDRLGVAISLGHGRGVVFELDLLALAVMGHDGRAGLGGGIGQDGCGAGKVEFSRFAFLGQSRLICCASWR